MHGVNQTARTAGDEDGADHIGFETPRSGVATPQPDLQDKRLPGIMSYFGQVRQSSSATNMYSSLSQRPESAMPLNQKRGGRLSASSASLQSQVPAESSVRHSDTWAPDHFLFKHEVLGLQSDTERHELGASHPYPTPPVSQSSSRGCSTPETSSEGADGKPTAPTKSSSALSHPKMSSVSPFTTTHFQSDESPATDPKDSIAHSLSCATIHDPNPASSSKSPPTSDTVRTVTAPSKWYSLDGLKELTRAVTFKSGPPTPTRALSAARPSASDVTGKPSNDGAEASGTHTPRSTTSGAQAPAPKGKLTIKIIEARGLRRSRDPYVVVVFQRSELISGGPQPSDEDDNLSVATPGIGGIPIQRQGSDSGRPMAILMRSRQSSNTSVTDYNTFRSRSARLSFTSPKWDAEAEL